MTKLVSNLFGGGDSAPAPAPVPAAPATDAGAEAARAQAATDAQTASAAAGRRSTMVAGLQLAQDDQYQRGLLSQKKRAAARDLGG